MARLMGCDGGDGNDGGDCHDSDDGHDKGNGATMVAIATTEAMDKNLGNCSDHEGANNGDDDDDDDDDEDDDDGVVVADNNGRSYILGDCVGFAHDVYRFDSMVEVEAMQCHKRFHDIYYRKRV